MTSETTAEHRWLQRLVGEWSYEAEATTSPDAPPHRFAGTESIRSLDGLWVVAEARGEVPGGGMGSSITTLGYDPGRRRVVGTFIGSTMPQLWVYEGEIDTAGDRLVLETEGPSFNDDGTVWSYRDIVEMRGDDLRLFHSTCHDPGKGWYEFMTTTYRRVEAPRP